MLSPEEFQWLNNAPVKEALYYPIQHNVSRGQRAASLLAGDITHDASKLTIGDMLFRWARVEQEALDESGFTYLKQVSDLFGAVGKLPKRFSLFDESVRSAEQIVASDLATMYVEQRIAGQIFQAQGCEASICGASSATDVLINGLQAVVHNSDDSLPTKIEKITIVTNKVLEKSVNLQNNPLVCVIANLGDFMSGQNLGDEFFAGLNGLVNIALFANAAAHAGQIILKRDKLAAMNIASLASTSLAGHFGAVAGAAATTALIGATGSWLIVLAPVAASFGGRVVIKNVARRARYYLFCRQEEQALRTALAKHCIASRDALHGNIEIAARDAEKFKHFRASATDTMRICIDDWLDRLEHIQQVRRVNADRFHRAVSDPTTLDHQDGDILTAAQESILGGARAGLLPANIHSTTKEVVDTILALHRKMHAAVI
jgi:hypothetical protein